MKLAVTGKGGVGKTTFSSLLARLYATEGRPVIAIDANPDANLALALGFSPEEKRNITPVSELDSLIEERTGVKPGSTAPFYKLNPKVDDIPQRFSISKNGVKLLILGTVKKGGSGCFCPESALLRSLMSFLVFQETDIVIMDMDAGVEHLGRGTSQGMDAFIIVVEPGKRSIQTAESIKKLASDLGIKRCYIVGNKITKESDKEFIKENTSGFEILGFINYQSKVAEADLKGESAFDHAPEVLEEIKIIREKLERVIKGG